LRDLKWDFMREKKYVKNQNKKEEGDG